MADWRGGCGWRGSDGWADPPISASLARLRPGCDTSSEGQERPGMPNCYESQAARLITFPWDPREERVNNSARICDFEYRATP